MSDNETLMTSKQVAEFLHVSIATLDRMIVRDNLPESDYKIGGLDRRLWKRSTIISWLDNQCKNREDATA